MSEHEKYPSLFLARVIEVLLTADKKFQKDRKLKQKLLYQKIPYIIVCQMYFIENYNGKSVSRNP